MAMVDANTVLLLHMNGAPNGVLFKDSSRVPKVVTADGGKTVAEGFKFGRSALDTGKITIADHADFNFGSADFTIEAFVNLVAASLGGATDVLFCRDGVSPNFGFRFIYQYNPNKWILDYSVDGTSFTSADFAGAITAADTPVHIALVRHGSDLLLFKDGVETLQGNTIAGTLHNGNVNPGVNFYTGTPSGVANNMRVDELRVSNIARWTSNFTPPTKPYGDTERMLSVLRWG